MAQMRRGHLELSNKMLLLTFMLKEYANYEVGE